MVTAQRLDGVDISRWQTNTIDYAAAMKAGVRWVFHKATEGTTVKDPNYARRRAEAKAAGLPFGAYHFAHPSSDARRSAEVFLATANPRPGDMRPMLDFEHADFTRWTIERRSAWVRTFVELVEAATGQPPLIYTQMDLTSTFGCPLWVARYSNANNAPRVPAPWKNWTVWQFTNGVFGVPKTTPGFGAVDANVMNGDPARLTASFVLGALPGTEPKPTPPTNQKPSKTVGFRFATFNALGHSHTDSPSGSKFGTRWAKSAARTALLATLLTTQRAGVVGLQEFQPPQQKALARLLGKVYASHAIVDNAVLWLRAAWTEVRRDSITVPYFGGKPRRMPVVVLDRKGVDVRLAFISTHNPAHTENADHRAEGWRIEAAAAEQLLVEHPDVDAVVCFADRNAKPAVFVPAFRKLGADQVSVASVWEIDSIAAFTRPERPVTFEKPVTTWDALVKKASDHPFHRVNARIRRTPRTTPAPTPVQPPKEPTMADRRYERTTHDGKAVDRWTKQALQAAEKLLGYELSITQGSWSTSVGASAGTHSGAGVVDLKGWDADRKVAALRACGFAAWKRTPSQGPWPTHVHAVLIDNERAAASAQRQVASYRAGRNGLANNARDDGPRVPIKAFRYQEKTYTAGQRPLREGHFGPDVATLQQLLKVTADGDFGPKTKAAVVKFERAQVAKGVRLNAEDGGVVGNATWRALGITPTTAKK